MRTVAIAIVCLLLAATCALGSVTAGTSEGRPLSDAEMSAIRAAAEPPPPPEDVWDCGFRLCDDVEGFCRDWEGHPGWCEAYGPTIEMFCPNFPEGGHYKNCTLSNPQVGCIHFAQHEKGEGETCDYAPGTGWCVGWMNGASHDDETVMKTCTFSN